MEPEAHSKRGRLMGKLFGRDRKASNPKEGPPPNDDLHSFFGHGPVEAPLPVPAAPPMLAKLDTSAARRYPNAHDVHTPTNTSPRHYASQQAATQSLPVRTHPQSSKVRGGKGLVVRFVDTFPEVIGEGGDECQVPTAEIGKRKKALLAAQPAKAPRTAIAQERDRTQPDGIHTEESQGSFVPQPLKRTQTGYSSIADASPPTSPSPPPMPAIPQMHDVPYVAAGNPRASQFLDGTSADENRKSFIEINQAKQRQAEGMAFAKAVRSASMTDEHEWEEHHHDAASASSPTESLPASGPPSNPESPESLTKRRPPPVDQRPPINQHMSAQRPPSDQSPATPVYNPPSRRGSPALNMTQRWPSVRDQKLGDSPQRRTPATDGGVVPFPADDALDLFLTRTRHLFALFRLQAETVKPLLSSLPDDLARAALWWFLKGRMALELSIREQPQNAQHAAQIQASRQQAYADLAKPLWIFQEVIPEAGHASDGHNAAEVQDVGQTIMSQLGKLASSMKRNGFLPPEEPFLPQTIDKTIWLDYPAINQDIVALLWGSWNSSIAAPQGPLTGLPLLNALPLGDTADLFCFGRYNVDLCLMEQGMEEQKFHFPCFLSITRPTTQSSLEFCIASQNGAVQLRIQNDKKSGPTWSDLKWRAESSCLEMKLPRGFIVAIKCRSQDFKMLWSMHDFSCKALATLQPRKDEQCVFLSKLRSFQYFDSNPQSMAFPKEAIRGCDIALFERTANEVSPSGQRTYHRGFRLAVVTGTGTKLLSAVNHLYTPRIPTQYGYLRGEGSEPAFLLKFDDGGSSGRMVMSFKDEPERLRFHTLLIGTVVQQDEKIHSEVPLVGYSLSKTAKSAPLQVFAQLPWSRAKVINEDSDDEIPETVLSERLRVIMDFKCGTITDRINVGPGELKIRLPVTEKASLMILRQPQQDMTISLSESQVSKQVPADIFQALQIASSSATVRTLSFTSQRDLHDFQQALTGFKVLFDGVVALFAISRRRMVVPIYKKWEAVGTRVQVVKSEENIIQVLVFFEKFHHGECMSFQLKATDVFEQIKKGDKTGVKIDDAKFPLPLLPEEKKEPTDDMAFVCLDMPEIPGEHDDITILFDSEEDRDDFIRTLPAPVKGSKIAQGMD